MCLFFVNFCHVSIWINPCNHFVFILTRLVIQLCIWVYLGYLLMNSKVTSLSCLPFILRIISFWIINFLYFQICSSHSFCYLVMLGFHFLALWCIIYGYGGYGVLCSPTISNRLFCYLQFLISVIKWAGYWECQFLLCDCNCLCLLSGALYLTHCDTHLNRCCCISFLH